MHNQTPPELQTLTPIQQSLDQKQNQLHDTNNNNQNPQQNYINEDDHRNQSLQKQKGQYSQHLEMQFGRKANSRASVYNYQIELPRIKVEKVKKEQSFNVLNNRMNRVIKMFESKQKNPIFKNTSLIQHNKPKICNLIKTSQPPLTSISKSAKKTPLPQISQKLSQPLPVRPILSLPASLSLLPQLQLQLQQSPILQSYKIISHIGKGNFSTVSSAIHKPTNTKYAIKTYTRIDQLNPINLTNIQNQIHNLFHLQHEHVIGLKHAVRDGRKIQLIMENGGQQSLSGLLRRDGVFGQAKAKKYFKQVAQGVEYCHKRGVSHRDIKLENILVDQRDQVKIIDFGFSAKCDGKMRMTSFCGTPPYMSPEIAARLPYNGLSSDVWALGVALYLMLTGKFPFKAANQKELYRLIQQGKYKNENFSPEIKNLLDSMLKVDQKTRITAEEIIQSDWLNKQKENR